MVRQVLVAGPRSTYTSTHHQWDESAEDAKDKVSKRILSQGTTGEGYLKYIAAGEAPIAVGDFQQSDPTFDSKGTPQWDYQIQDGFIDHVRIQDGQVLAIEQKADTIIAQGGWVFGEDGTGLAIPESAAAAGDIAIGKAEESNTVAAGEEGEVLVKVTGQQYVKPAE